MDLFGFGGRSPGQAGIGVATASDYDAVYLNPSGLALATGKRLTVGILRGKFSLSLNRQPTDTEPASGAVLGAVLPIPLGGWLQDRVVLGFGFYVPKRTLNRARAPMPGVPTFALLETRSHVVALQSGIGVKVSDSVSVGIAVIALAALRGGIDVAATTGGEFQSQSEQELITKAAPIVGVVKRLDHRLRLGAVLRGASRSDYNIVVTSDLGDALPLELPTIHIAGNAQFDPMTLAIEASWQPWPTVSVATQLALRRYSAYPAPTVDPVAGDSRGLEPDFRDTAVPRIGIEWRGAFTARAGYAFEMSPAPEMTERLSLLDNHRHIAAAGLGLSFRLGPNRYHADAWLQTQWLVKRRHDKNPALSPPVATLIGDGHILAGGVTLGVDL